MKSSNNESPLIREIPAAKKQGSRSRDDRRLKLGACLVLGVWTLVFFWARDAEAQFYSIDWYKISGGGGISTNGQFALSGTIGQPDASGSLLGGNYSLTGGFWSLYAVQTPGAPWLTINVQDNQAIISWPVTASGWTLQTNNNLATSAWGNYLGTIVNNRVTNAPPSDNLFFRLKQ